MSRETSKPPAWIFGVLAAMAVICAAAVWIISRPPVPSSQLVRHLPYGDRVLISLDVAALRSAGILTSVASVAEDNDYQAFVKATAFNYRRDLNHLYLSIGNNETFAWAVGRFNWKRLQEYAASQGGSCRSAVCRLDSPTPGRKISFRRNGSGVLAFASSADPDAVQRMFVKPAAAPPPDAPARPIWFLFPHASLQSPTAMPTGSRMFTAAIAGADHVFLSIGPRDGRFEATLDALANNDQQAQEAVRELQAATTVLNRMLAREKQQPNPRDLSGVLARGEFSQQGVHVKGAWPIERAFLDSLSLTGSQP